MFSKVEPFVDFFESTEIRRYWDGNDSFAFTIVILLSRMKQYLNEKKIAEYDSIEISVSYYAKYAGVYCGWAVSFWMNLDTLSAIL